MPPLRRLALMLTAIKSDAKGPRSEDAPLKAREKGSGGICGRETPAAENPEESAQTKHRPEAARSLPEFKLSNFT